MAAKGGFVDVVSLLLDENPNVNAVDQVSFENIYFYNHRHFLSSNHQCLMFL